MGGLGSGRPARWPSLWSLYSLRTQQIRKACNFVPGLDGTITFGDGTTIQVRTSPGYAFVNEVPLLLDWTEPHFGGRRTWFRCPNCGRRCSVVYGKERGWACRRCWRANYPSQKEGRFDRLIRRARALRRRLGDRTVDAPIDHVELAGTSPDKPKGMHERTYHRLATELERVESEAARLFHEQAARVLGRWQARGWDVS
jgi:hypothetical protein